MEASLKIRLVAFRLCELQWKASAEARSWGALETAWRGVAGQIGVSRHSATPTKLTCITLLHEPVDAVSIFLFFYDSQSLSFSVLVDLARICCRLAALLEESRHQAPS